MGSSASSREISIFLAAIEKETEDELVAYLEEACGDDAGLRSHIEELVATHRRDKSFLERAAPGLERTVDVSRDALEAGLASAFDAEAAVVMGSASHSVLKSISKHLPRTPHVVLRENEAEEGRVAQTGSPELPTAESDSRYQLHGEIARGGMGAIIKGRDTDLGRDLAIKVLLDSHKDKPDVMQRFVEEAQIGGQLQHPGIVPVYELGQFGDQRPFFTMKLVKGQTLAALLAKRKDPADDLPKLLGIFEQVCQTMAYAHSKGVIHRDLKPANIMVGAFGEVQVMDWGLAKVLGAGGVDDEQQSLDKHRDVSVIKTRRSVGSDTPGEVGSQTQMGSVMGTPAYMPPEQALGEIDRLDARADVFGLGAILTEILTGKPPYVAEDSTQVFRMASRGTLDDCFQRLDASGADPELAELARTALSLEPIDRFGDAGELAGKVTQHLEGVQDRLKVAEIDRAKAQTRRKLLAAIAAVLLVFGVSAAIAAFRFNQLAEEQTKLARANKRLAVEQTKLAIQNKQLADDNDVQRRMAVDARQEAEDGERRAEVRRLAALSRAIGEELPIQAALLAIEAVNVTRSHDGSVLPAAQSALLNSVSDLGGVPLPIDEELRNRPNIGMMARRLGQVAISPNGRWLVTGGVQSLRLWNLAAPSPQATGRVLRGHQGVIESVQFSADSQWLFTASRDKTAIGWNLTLPDPSASTLVFRGHRKLVRLALSPDGHWLATGSLDGTARLWDLTSPNPTDSYYEIIGRDEERDAGSASFTYEGRVDDIAFSPDGRWLATAGAPESCRLWDLSNNDPNVQSLVLEGHTANVLDLAFSPESRWLVTGSRDKTARLWDLQSPNPAGQHHVLRPHDGPVSSVVVSADGRWIATSGKNDPALLWNLDDDVPKLTRTLTGHEGGILDLAISPTSRWLMTASLDNTARLWDLRAADPTTSVIKLRGHDDAVSAATFTPDSQSLVTVSWDGTGRIWDLASGTPESEVVVRGSGDAKLLFTADGHWLMSGGRDGTIRLWDFTAEVPPRAPTALQTDGASRLRFGMSASPDSRWLAATTGVGGVSLWDLTVDNVSASRRRLEGHTGVVWLPTFSPNSRWLATSGLDDKTVHIWNVATRDPDFGDSIVLDDHGDGVKGTDFSLDGQWFASACVDGMVRLWNLEKLVTTGATKPFAVVETDGGQHYGGVNFVRFSGDSRYLAAFRADGPGYVWDLGAEAIADTRRPLAGHTNAIMEMGIALDGRSAVTVCWDPPARLWSLDVTQGNPVSVELRGHSNALTTLATGPKGRWLATVAEDNTARLWDLSSENPTASQLVLRGHDSMVSSVAFSPDGRWVVTGGGDKTIRLWDRDIESVLRRVRNLTGRELTPDERERYQLPPMPADDSARGG